jgi:hypothetical protein
LAPPGGVLIGEGTYGRLPVGTVVERRGRLELRGKTSMIDAYLLLALP